MSRRPIKVSFDPHARLGDSDFALHVTCTEINCDCDCGDLLEANEEFGDLDVELDAIFVAAQESPLTCSQCGHAIVPVFFAERYIHEIIHTDIGKTAIDGAILYATHNEDGLIAVHPTRDEAEYEEERIAIFKVRLSVIDETNLAEAPRTIPNLIAILEKIYNYGDFALRLTSKEGVDPALVRAFNQLVQEKEI